MFVWGQGPYLELQGLCRGGGIFGATGYRVSYANTPVHLPGACWESRKSFDLILQEALSKVSQVGRYLFA